MAEQTLPEDFKEFLKLLNENGVEYLLVGGYAVGYHGYARATADIDIWIGVSPENAEKTVRVFREFGMSDPALTPGLFLQRGKIVRMGVPPTRIEVLNDIDGVDFAECYAAREDVQIDEQSLHLISLKHLRQNKLASGRLKDLADVEHLPE